MHLEVYAASAVAVVTVASSSASALALATSGSCVVQNCSAQSRSWSAMHRSAERVKMLQPEGPAADAIVLPEADGVEVVLKPLETLVHDTPAPTEVQKLKRRRSTR